jgi:hypothetical protein
MNRLASTGSFILAILLINAVVAEGQQPLGQIGSVGGIVDVIDSSGSAAATRGQPLVESEKIHTGGASFADLIIGSNGEALMSEQTQIQLQRLGASPLLWLEHGKVKVRSSGPDVLIQTKFGLFSAVEWPFEVEVTNLGGTVNVVVTEGRIRTQNPDPASITFGAPGDKGFRSFTAGSTFPRTDNPPTPPNVFVQSCIPPGSNNGFPGSLPAPTPGPVKQRN